MHTDAVFDYIAINPFVAQANHHVGRTVKLATGQTPSPKPHYPVSSRQHSSPPISRGTSRRRKCILQVASSPSCSFRGLLMLLVLRRNCQGVMRCLFVIRVVRGCVHVAAISGIHKEIR